MVMKGVVLGTLAGTAFSSLLACAHSGIDYDVDKEHISCGKYSENNADIDLCAAYPKAHVIFIYSKRVSAIGTVCDATVISYDKSLGLAEKGIVRDILVPIRENLGNDASCSASAYLGKPDDSPETGISKGVKWTTLEDKGCDGVVDSVARGTGILPDSCYRRSDKQMSEGYDPDRLFNDMEGLFSR